MTKGSIDTPKIFISYSWTNEAHEQWVLGLAERLSADGIVVILDKWDLKEGQDKHAFMEQMVKDASIKRVLVICDRAYQEKADKRSGGVGTETQIISKKVYEDTVQEKFIAIVRELDSQGTPCVPTYMASRIYIDLSTDDRYEENYQRLVRNLYDKPRLKRPSLGVAPAFLEDESPPVPRASHRVSEIKLALLNGRQSANGLIAEFLGGFRESLEEFRVSGGLVPGFDDQVLESIERMAPLREEFIDFTKIVFSYQTDVNLEVIHDFFESLVVLGDRPATVTSFTEIDFDNYRVFIYELTLNFMAMLLHLKKYKEFGYFANSSYLYGTQNSGDLQAHGIGILNRYAQSLDGIRNARLNLRRVSVTADLIKSHATRRDIIFTAIQEADLILHYATELRAASVFNWFPRTSVFGPTGPGTDLLARMVSRRQFERLKPIFQIETDTELKAKITAHVERTRNQPRNIDWNYQIRPLEKALDPERIATLP
jgi:hypothetical protein